MENIAKVLNVPIQLSSEDIELPKYQTTRSSGADLCANLKDNFFIHPYKIQMIPTGIKIKIPQGYEAQIRPRSGLSLKNGIMAILGTIDEDFVGELGIIVVNLSDKVFVVKPKMRLAQLVFTPVIQAEFEVVEKLEKTDRGEGGFGHTGH